MHFLLIIFVALFSIFGGRPTQKTRIYLEKGKQLVAFQETGDKGKVSFEHLDAGSYRILVAFPQQDGKYTKDKPKYRSLTKATYNPRKKTYYYQGNEGYFSVRFFGISKIKSENFKAVFREEKTDDGTGNVIAEFGAHKNNAGICLKVETLTASQFHKAVEKAGSDISTLSIPNIR